jgi:TusA-related sulfurtransferase
MAAHLVDVSDMLCAQALALVARAVAQAPPGGAVDVRYTTQDVKQDLLIWSKELGHAVSEPEPALLRIERRAAP